MTIKEIRQLTNLSQPKFCEKYGIPLATLRKWEQGHRTCSSYVAELLEFKVKEDLKMENFNAKNMFLKPERPFLLIYADNDEVNYAWLESEEELKEVIAEVASYGCKICDAIEIGSLREIDFEKDA